MANLKTHFDYLLVNGAAEVLYLGQAEEWIDDNQPKWTIRKFTWVTAADSTTQLGQVSVLTGVPWADRASLSWP